MIELAVAPYVGAWIETLLATTSLSRLRVAPYVGAWIETHIKIKAELKLSVAPYVGAWIETTGVCRFRQAAESHPTWVRGLKPDRVFAPDKNIPSHPTWVRGLKH